MLILRRTTVVLTLLMASAQAALAAGLGQSIATQGNGKGATACIACHGVDGGGQAQAAFPRLAGLNQAYLEKQLHDFAKGSRTNSTMQPVAKALTDKEIKAVAAYFSQLPIPANHDATTADPAVINDGKKLAQNGNWPNDIPACFTCHGAGANGIGPHFPVLAGQHASYIENQLQAWREGHRNNDPNELMKGVAMRLSHDEIKAVSAYLASLKPSAR
jgi:cytochrome c553